LFFLRLGVDGYPSNLFNIHNLIVRFHIYLNCQVLDHSYVLWLTSLAKVDKRLKGANKRLKRNIKSAKPVKTINTVKGKNIRT